MEDYAPQSGPSRDREEVFSTRVPAGKRTYFFDVKATRSGEDFFLVLTESKRQGDGYRKHKIYLYKEDFGKFINGLHEAIDHVRDELLPDYEFEDLPEELAYGDEEEYDDEYEDDLEEGEPDENAAG